ncbi:FAD-dependent oxidoreductase [Roseibium denhamense]|uniref:Monoamine oxidase n=1 Tax=Roseibium denhamense TaxID=76305 RepID=A0ABY1NL36_9HYPH|nr:FAD-dependent oxidoreductase [Roseibium denhamense]MTI06700.1 FAD-dependent oxidoreductase [Roseibium denhamense]SMP10418.1 monoamine oxidase [Roseibium denhamense]
MHNSENAAMKSGQPYRPDVAVIGAGLSGLMTARLLVFAGFAVTVFEARDRVGGRILSGRGASMSGGRYDLGPAWLWPHNTRLLALMDELSLPLMRQHSEGRLVFQDGHGKVRRDLDMATMAEGLRVPGGLSRLTEALAVALPAGTVQLGHRLETVHSQDDGIRLTGRNAQSVIEVLAPNAVLALPPRVAAAGLVFGPDLPADFKSRLTNVPTWMAGHSKMVAVYERAFWRDAGLSGDAISHKGPLFEIHDASCEPDSKGEAALFGFVAPGLAQPNVDEGRLKEAAVNQLAELFGQTASHPTEILFQNWASDDLTATAWDTPALGGHPRYQRIGFDGTPFSNKLWFASTEVAEENGGFLEGALEAAKHTAAAIIDQR